MTKEEYELVLSIFSKNRFRLTYMDDDDLNKLRSTGVIDEQLAEWSNEYAL